MSQFHFDPSDLPEDMPQGLKDALLRQVDRQNMRTQADIHDVNMFLDGLKEDQLSMLHKIVAVSANSPTSAAYYAGRIDELLMHRFKKCSCGERHDPAEELLDSTNFPAEEPETLPSESQQVFEHPRMNKPFAFMHKADQTILLTHWNLAFDSQNILRCTKCGMQYVSVEDRLLRDEDGCHGCHKMTGDGAPFGPRPGERGW